MRKLLIIPAFNEESKIGNVVGGVPAGTVDEICVVDDGSNDNTAQLSINSGAFVITHPQNLGVGASIRDGLNYAIDKGFDIAIVISGDDQHNSCEISRFTAPIENEGYDFIQGSRYLTGGSIVNPNFFRVWGIRIYTMLFRLLLKARITDGTNGFRAFRTSIIKDGNIDLDQTWLNRYELEPYLLYKVVRGGFKFKEVPVTIKYHSDGSYTKMTPFKGWWSLFRPIVFLALGIRR
jgi:dolichol-phosphate mannosyltransferase